MIQAPSGASTLSIMAECFYTEFLYSEFLYIECRKYTLSAGCHYAECCYPECHYAECHGTFLEVILSDGYRLPMDKAGKSF
jgi:hypothetical protein